MPSDFICHCHAGRTIADDDNFLDTRLHAKIAEWAVEAVEQLLAEARVPASEVTVIAFPGQTIWHEPPAVSWQLGEPAILAERFGVRVVSGFRARDVAAGGQGAPLVPMADVEHSAMPLEHATDVAPDVERRQSTRPPNPPAPRFVAVRAHSPASHRS